MKNLRNIVWLTQLGLSVASPLVLGILGALWLRDRFALGGWVMLAGILLGVGGAVSGLAHSLRAMNRQSAAEEGDGKPPTAVSFNDHI